MFRRVARQQNDLRALARVNPAVVLIDPSRCMSPRPPLRRDQQQHRQRDKREPRPHHGACLSVAHSALITTLQPVGEWDAALCASHSESALAGRLVEL